MSRLSLLVLNTISLIAVIIFNALAGSGNLGDYTMGELSAKYDTLITPAGYAFSIWGLIYMFLTAYVIFQWYAYKKQKFDETIDQAGPYFLLSNVANIAWLLLWLNEYLGFSIIAMAILLLSLVKLVIRLDLERWDAPVRIIAFVWWPIAIYLGWIIVASVTNVAAFLVFLQWDGFQISAEIWTIIMLLIATVIYLLLTFTRNLRESATVGIWAFIAIAIKQWDINQNIAIFAIAGAVILLIATAYHGAQNRATAPDQKIKRGEI